MSIIFRRSGSRRQATFTKCRPCFATASSRGCSPNIPSSVGCSSITSTRSARTSIPACSAWRWSRTRPCRLKSSPGGSTIAAADSRVNGRPRLLEGLAQPREETEFRLRYYNTLTTWVDLERLLDAFGLTRRDIADDSLKVAAAVRTMAARVPTYVTVKDVKRRWGHAQEDVFPVAQFEKLWGDLTSLPDLACSFLAVDR